VLSLLYYEAATTCLHYVNGGMNAPLAKLAGWGANATSTGLGAGVPGFWPIAKRHARSSAASRQGSVRVSRTRDGFEIHPFLWGEMFSSMNMLGRSEQGREISSRHPAAESGRAARAEARGRRDRLVSEGNAYFKGDFARDYSAVVRGAGGVIARRLRAYDVRFDEPARGHARL
jgi:gamma-glutamyltranspeptidase/glutathione hydrolase